MKTKAILTAAALLVVLISCGSKSNSTSTKESGKAEVSPMATMPDEGGKSILLTKAMFLDRVMNYETSEEWNYQGNVPAIIDFYADWCGPCRATSPILEEIAKEYEGKLIVYKIDTEAERELASVFGVRSLPTFLFIPVEGQPVMSAGIARTKEETKQMFVDQINKYLLSNTEGSL